MKKMSLILVLLTICLFSCNKDEIISAENNNQTLIKSNIIDNVYSMRIDNGIVNSSKNNILVFPDFNSYLEAIDKLEEINSKNNSFNRDLNNNEDQLLIDFENELNFTSLRLKINKEEEEWLKTQDFNNFDFENDPDNHMILNETERALLNEVGEVIIGNNKKDFIIYKFMKDGTIITIENFDLETLSNLNTNGYIPFENPNIKTNVSSRSVICKTQASTNTMLNVPGTNLWLKGQGSLVQFAPIISKVTSKTSLYERFGSINLPKTGWIEASLQGYYKKYTCGLSSEYRSNISNTSNNSQVSVSFSINYSGNNEGILLQSDYPQLESGHALKNATPSLPEYIFFFNEPIW